MGSLTLQIVIAFVFGVIFVVTMLMIAIYFPKPTPFQYNVFRVVFALAAAGIAAMIPGFINLTINPSVGLLIRAGGALAVFIIVFFFNPAPLPNGPNGDGPDEIQISIPEGWTFEKAARGIAKVAYASVKFKGFMNEQLTQALRETDIKAPNVKEALLQLQDQNENLPKYKIYFKKGVYTIYSKEV